MTAKSLWLAIAALLPYALASDDVDLSSFLNMHRRVREVAAGVKPFPPLGMARDYARYRKEAPTVVAAAAAAALQTGKVTANNGPNDINYLCPVKVGKTTLMLDFDTGSSDLWVFSTAMPANQRAGHQTYKLGGSQASGETWAINYGDGSGASGIVYGDSVVVGGATATVQAVEAATSASASFVYGNTDGLLGLGMDYANTCSPYQCYTFMHQIAPTLPQEIFTATLRYHSPGEYDFGFIDSSKYTGTIAYIPVTDNQFGGYWEFIASGYSIGTGAKKKYSIDAIADTGTSLVYTDASIIQSYYSNIPSAVFNTTYAGYIFACSDASKLRSFSVFINNAKRTMPGKYANYRTLTSPAGYCYGGLQENTGLGFTILGDIFLKSQFVVFDYGNTRLGFAQQANPA